MIKEITQDEIISDSCYLFFPKEDEILLNIGNFSLRRFFFHVKEYTKYEENLLLELTVMVQKLTTPNDILLYSLLNDKEKLLRYLHLTNNQKDTTIKLLTRFLELSSIYDVNFSNIEVSENISSIINSGILKVIGRDKKMRPILLNNLYTFSNDSPHLIDLVKAYIFVLKFVIENMLLPGQIEQIILIIKLSLNEETDSKLESVFDYIQLYFPCRFHNILIFNNETNTESFKAGVLESIVTDYNKECLNNVNKTTINELSYIFSQHTINKIINDTSQKNYISNDLKDDSIFDSEKEKEENLISKNDYIRFFSDPLNRDFYRFNEKVFNSFSRSEMLGSKEFKIENFETFNPKLLMKINYNNTIDTDENSQGKDKKDVSKINEKIKMIKSEYNIFKSKKVSFSRTGNKPKYTNKDQSSSSKHNEEIKSKTVNKSFSFIDNESCNLLFNIVTYLKQSGTSEKLDSFDKKKLRSNVDSMHRGFVIDCSQRNESCCKFEEKCLII